MSDLFLEFIATGTVRRKTIALYGDQAAADELAALATKAATLTDDELDALAKTWDEVKSRWEASRADVTVVRLTDEIRAQLEQETPVADPPRPAGSGATKKRIEQADAERAEWAAQLLETTARRSRLALVYGIEQFTFRGETRTRELNDDGTVKTPTLSPEEIETLFATPYGTDWQAQITEAFNEVSTTAKEPDVPFSLANSGGDPT